MNFYNISQIIKFYSPDLDVKILKEKTPEVLGIEPSRVL